MYTTLVTPQDCQWNSLEAKFSVDNEIVWGGREESVKRYLTFINNLNWKAPKSQKDAVK